MLGTDENKNNTVGLGIAFTKVDINVEYNMKDYCRI